MTLAEILTSIRAKGFETDTDAQQRVAVNSVYRRINGMRRWPYLERRSTALLTTANQPNVSLINFPALMWIDAVRLKQGTEDFTLTYRAPQELREDQAYWPDAGVPDHWTQAAGELVLWPTPSAAYTVVLDYTTTPADLTLDADVPVFDSTYHDLLVWGAVVELGFRQRDANLMSMAKTEFNERLTEMVRSYGIRQRQGTLAVQPNEWWDRAATG